MRSFITRGRGPKCAILFALVIGMLYSYRQYQYPSVKKPDPHIEVEILSKESKLDLRNKSKLQIEIGNLSKEGKRELRKKSKPHREVGISSKESERELSNESNKPHIVFGILSGGNQRERRDAQRNTWLATTMHADIPFKLTYKFLMDRPTENTTEENKIHHDIIYLNVTTSGYAIKFGEKIYIWIKYIMANYPDAYLGARIDDDVFLCVPEIFERLDQIKSSKLYYGLAHGSGAKISGEGRRVDEMFIVFGRELMQRISRREYCEDREKCNAKQPCVEQRGGGPSVAQWLSIYDDINFIQDNNRMIWYMWHMKKEGKHYYAKYVKPHFCNNSWLLYHKSTPEIMRILHSRYRPL